MDQCVLWHDKYDKMAYGAVRWEGERERSATLCRARFLEVLLVAIERLNPEELDDLEEARRLLIRAGETAEDDYYRPPPRNAIEEAAVSEARRTFCEHVVGLSRADLERIDSLPFRRVLGKAEAKALWRRVHDRWDVSMDKEYWYPLAPCRAGDVVAFDARAFLDVFEPSSLQELIASRGIARVFEFREDGPEYELELALLEPFYTLAEGYWTSDAMDWIVYASHEDSLTLGGWIAEAVKLRWPTWRAHVWGQSS